MAHFFIHRPVFAIVVSLILLIAGGISLFVLPVAQYPQITPPMIQVEVNYPGASAGTVENSIATNIEQSVNGAEHMIYMSSKSSSDGRYVLQVVFEVGTNIDLANVDVNNRVQQAIPKLPSDAVNAGVSVTKQSPDMLMVISVYSPDKSYDDVFISNYATINLVDAIARTPGVGSTMIVGQRDYAMRLWLRPDRLAQLGLTPADISNTIQEQNVLAPAGSVGQAPSSPGVSFQYTVDVKGRLSNEQEFGNMVIQTLPDGSILRVRDVARIELAAKTYSSFGRRDGVPSALINVYQLPGANGIETAGRLKKLMEELGANMPAGLKYDVTLDTTKFVSAAIEEVLHALRDAILLVFLVVFLFLGSFRATLIPMLAVPVSLIGTFAAFVPLGFSINTLTLFAIVLAVGIVVDDAIVVVEAVQHHIEQGLTPLEATEQAMREVSGPVVAIALVLCAVFVPVAFMGGITGQLYRQFAITLSVSVLLSALVALSLTPALCRRLLKPHAEMRGPLGRLLRGFNSAFEKTTNGYLSLVSVLLRRLAVGCCLLLALSIGGGALAKFLPTGFVPDEDLGYFYAIFSLPDGASLERTTDVAERAEAAIKKMEGVQNVLTQGGYNQLTGTYSSHNVSLIVVLKPWEQRQTAETQSRAIIAKLRAEFSRYPEALSIVAVPPPIPGLGSAGGLQLEVQDRSGAHTPSELHQVSEQFLAGAATLPEVSGAYNSFRANVPQLELELDRDKTKQLGIPVSNVFQSLQIFLGGLLVNDFNLFGRTYKVAMQAEPEFRARPDQIQNLFVRSGAGDMVPLSALARIERKIGPDVIQRYNMFRSAEINSSNASGFSTGQSIQALENFASTQLPGGYGYEWTGTAFQEKAAGSSQVFILLMGLGFVFLFLAAQYESWAIPLGVILGLPLGIFGALGAIGMRGIVNDIYAQIGIVMLMGLAAKNAILIVEFARNKRDEGMPAREAALAGAKLRFRPILMTAFAFILGVVPLVIADGAGSASRRTMGTAVFGGMAVATFLGVFIVPVLYTVIELWIERRARHAKGS